MKIGKGVRIRVVLIIHDKNALSAMEGSVFKTLLYVMKPLRDQKALEVFQDLKLDKNQELVVTKIIKICKGYKKRMEIVREYLFNYYIANNEDFKRLSEWIEIKERNFAELADYLNCEKQFLHLSVIAKDALLDICSFFKDWNWHETACIIDVDVLEKLKELQLVKRESDKVSVPPSVLTYCLSRAKGRRITEASDLHDVMLAEKEEPEKFERIQGIWMLKNKFPFHIPASDLDKMENLRVLALGDWTIVTGTCSKKLRHLGYFQAGKLEALPFNIGMVDNLRFLDNNSKHYFGTGSQEVPPTLRMVKSKGMKLEHYLDWTNLPEGCELTDLNLGGVDVEDLPNALCDVYSLQNIFLSQCKKLKRLPKNFGKLQYLKTLNLSHCEALNDLSPSFGWLSCLEKVNFSYCRQLKHLPDTIGLLRSVKEMDFSYCKNLERLPKSFVKLTTLQALKLRGCSNLLELPEGFDGLALKELYLESCKRLKALHENVGAAASLTQSKISLSWCKSVTELSRGFISVIKAQVEELILVDCVSLQMLPEDFPTELSRLKILNLSGCKSLSSLPRRFSKLKYLQRLNLESCEKLEESSIKLGHLTSLQEVNLSNCYGLAGDCLGSLITIQSLTYLDIHGSPKLVDRWNRLNRDRRTCHMVVTTARPGLGSLAFSKTLKEDPLIEKALKRGIYEFFNGKWIFLDLNGRQFYPSTLEECSTIAVIFDNNYQEPELKSLGRILDDLQATCEKLQIVYLGTCVSELAKKLAGRHLVCGCDNYGAQVFFEKALYTVEGFDQTINYAMIISDVECRDKHKAFSSWTGVTNERLMLMDKAIDFQKIEYLRLTDLIETESPQERSSTKLLRPLLLTNEIKFLISKTRQVEIKELESKYIFIFLSWLHNMEEEYKAFNNVYQRLQKLLNERENIIKFEVVWIPIVVEGRGTRAVHAKWVEKIEWLSIADPWSINPMVMRYFQRHTSFDKLPLLVAVSPNGIFYSDNLNLNTAQKEAEINITELERSKIREQVENKVREEVLMKLIMESKLGEEMETKVREEVLIKLTEESKFRKEMEMKVRKKVESQVAEEVLMKLIEESKLREEMEKKVREKVQTQVREEVLIKLTQESTLREEREKKVKEVLMKENKLREEMERKVIEEENQMREEMKSKIREQVESKVRKEIESKIKMEVETRIREEVESKVQEEVVLSKIEELVGKC